MAAENKFPHPLRQASAIQRRECLMGSWPGRHCRLVIVRGFVGWAQGGRRQPRTRVTTTGNGAHVVEKLQQARLVQTPQNAKRRCAGTDAATGQRQAHEARRGLFRVRLGNGVIVGRSLHTTVFDFVQLLFQNFRIVNRFVVAESWQSLSVGARHDHSGYGRMGRRASQAATPLIDYSRHACRALDAVRINASLYSHSNGLIRLHRCQQDSSKTVTNASVCWMKRR